jgi:hypothetical protein
MRDIDVVIGRVAWREGSRDRCFAAAWWLQLGAACGSRSLLLCSLRRPPRLALMI